VDFATDYMYAIYICQNFSFGEERIGPVFYPDLAYACA
jgi:hypothetical protein